MERQGCFSILLLRGAGGDDVIRSNRHFDLPFIVERSLGVTTTVSMLLISILCVSGGIKGPTPMLRVGGVIIPPKRQTGLALSSKAGI